MNSPVRWLAGLAALLIAGCATAPRQAIPDAAVAVLAASPEQLLIGKHRAESIYNRWTEEDRAKFARRGSPLLAVRTLGLTPDQAASLAGKITAPETAVCVVLWDAREKKIAGPDCYVVTTVPPRGEIARFSLHSARYVGSL